MSPKLQFALTAITGQNSRLPFVIELSEQNGGDARATKARQSAKIREIGDALRASGFVTVNQQAQVLNLSRSTAWTLVQGNHKGTGLSSSLIKRMLASPRLPDGVRTKITEYVAEKSAGLYGGEKFRLRRFRAKLVFPDTEGRAVRK